MNIIKDLINKSKFSMEEIADGVGCKRQTLYNWMKNPKSMNAEDIKKFAEFMDRSPRNVYGHIIKP